MALFKVEGGHRLSGEITPQGAKNEALQVICAVLLTAEEVIIENVPQILDVMQLIDLLRAMGVRVEQVISKGEFCGPFTPRDISQRLWNCLPQSLYECSLVAGRWAL